MSMGSAPGGSLTLGIMPTHIPEIGVNKPSNYELLSPTFKSFQQRSWASYNWDHSQAARAQPSQPLSEFSTHQIHERSTICFKTLSFGVPSCVAIVSHLKYRSYFMEKKESSKGITKNQRAEATASENCFQEIGNKPQSKNVKQVLSWILELLWTSYCSVSLSSLLFEQECLWRLFNNLMWTDSSSLLAFFRLKTSKPEELHSRSLICNCKVQMSRSQTFI